MNENDNKALTQNDITKIIAEKTKVSAQKIKEILNAQAELASSELKSVGSFTLAGIGKLKGKETPERRGRNPATGQPVTIKAARRVTISLNKAFKDGVQ